jgi:hypothetical protein
VSLKDLIQSDINDVFMNPDDFCDFHRIEGHRILCSIDSDSLISVSEGAADMAADMGMNESTIKIYASTSALLEIGVSYRGYGASIEFDGRLYTVMSWFENKGMTEITMAVPLTN